MPAPGPVLAPPNRLAVGWMLLALAALGGSTLCALALGLLRLPGTQGTGALFGRALVLHVGQAVVVWFLAGATVVWTLAAGVPARPARWAALVLAAAGWAAMVLALALPQAPAVLANYVPVLDHPLYLAGLGALLAGVGFSGVLATPALWRAARRGGAWPAAALASVLAAGLALLCGTWGVWHGAEASGLARYEQWAWAPGHALQFVHVLLLIGMWAVLGEALLGQPLAPLAILRGLVGVTALPALGAPVLLAIYGADGPELRRGCTQLMAWGLWPGAVLLALRLLWRIARAGPAVWRTPHTPALLLSALLFVLGCGLGALVRSDTTLVPAHYHGTVGAVTLAYMALGYRLLGAAPGLPWQRSQAWLYGLGLLALVSGLAWLGSAGAPRKTPQLAAWAVDPASVLALGLAGVGGILAIGGASWFVFNALRALLRYRPGGAALRFVTGWKGATAGPSGRYREKWGHQRTDVRAGAVLVTLLGVLLAGGLLRGLSTDSRGHSVAALDVATLEVSMAADSLPGDPPGRHSVGPTAAPDRLLEHVVGAEDPAAPWAGKWLVLNIWATWCAPCRKEMPSLQRLSQLLDERRFAVVGLSVDADPLLAQEFLRTAGIRFRNGFDPRAQRLQSLGVRQLPQTWLIAPDRRVVARWSGEQAWDSQPMVQHLQSLAQTAPQTAWNALP